MNHYTKAFHFFLSVFFLTWEYQRKVHIVEIENEIYFINRLSSFRFYRYPELLNFDWFEKKSFLVVIWGKHLNTVFVIFTSLLLCVFLNKSKRIKFDSASIWQRRTERKTRQNVSFNRHCIVDDSVSNRVGNFQLLYGDKHKMV